MSEERDELFERVASALRPLPEVNPEAKARVLIAIAAERERDRQSAARAWVPSRGARWAARIGGLAAAAVVATVLLRTPNPVPPAHVALVPTTQVPAQPDAPLQARLAGRDAADAESAPQPVQLVFRAPAASRVRVVGDFNAWDGDRAPMTRDAASGLWSVTLSLRPGRHVYAFVVDDTVWVRDPRAPAAPDADFGRPGSVLLVGRP